MVKLRLRRKGRTHHPVYDIVAMDGRSRRDGAFIERLGYYDPHINPSKISINADRAVYWLNVGAQPTDIVKMLFSYEGILLRRHLILKGKNQVEIEEEVAKHKQVVASRYKRRQQLRKKRKENKAKEKENEGKE
jgi:small subunit ribosomal protein S16